MVKELVYAPSQALANHQMETEKDNRRSPGMLPPRNSEQDKSVLLLLDVESQVPGTFLSVLPPITGAGNSGPVHYRLRRVSTRTDMKCRALRTTPYPCSTARGIPSSRNIIHWFE
ncbi:hypothetical protein BWQ96_07005 [Gracilariopsis chorda]|uniref:Uncharacterized protein n=1 Tax=Gracilariopsis chorda TaxID=448386 RepID=A0A2V3IMD3_9FLOR|nr:hypothetical protein BWQ96_07005 [Gracilariopsis chorda]|eukprot:PXF43232.1 hypothetical protein BWQ96_07005 [Gracilariopsis chorda]